MLPGGCHYACRTLLYHACWRIHWEVLALGDLLLYMHCFSQHSIQVPTHCYTLPATLSLTWRVPTGRWVGHMYSLCISHIYLLSSLLSLSAWVMGICRTWAYLPHIACLPATFCLFLFSPLHCLCLPAPALPASLLSCTALRLTTLSPCSLVTSPPPLLLDSACHACYPTCTCLQVVMGGGLGRTLHAWEEEYNCTTALPVWGRWVGGGRLEVPYKCLILLPAVCPPACSYCHTFHTFFFFHAI